MAVRTGAGTGVIVSLVVFVLTTVFLLVLTIVFYAGKTKEAEARAAADQALAKYVSPSQRNNDMYKNFEAMAKGSTTVAQVLNQRNEELLNFIGAQPNATMEAVKQEFSRFNLKDTDTLRSGMQSINANLSAARSETEALKTQLVSANAQIAEKEAQMKQADEAHAVEVQGFNTQIDSYRKASDEYRQRLEAAIDELNKAKDTLRNQYEGVKRQLEEEVDNLSRENQVLMGRIDEFERIRADAVFKAQNPAMQVDAKIVDVPSGSDQIFLDKGKKDKIVLGMTFEVYADPQMIRVNPQTGEVPRGKASLQVVKVNDTSSIAKVTRSSPGQPVIRGDVVANAVYDPAQEYKFLIHGKYDVDGDGKPTETEAEYLRSLVLQWGGVVVSGDSLPGDLDFLVLGAQPPNPPPPPADAPQALINDWIKRKEAYDVYNRLLKQAQDSQIPVLNANRFFILTGFVDR